MTNITNRLRYCSFYLWLVRSYERLRRSDDARRWSTSVRRGEVLYALATLIARTDGGLTGLDEEKTGGCLAIGSASPSVGSLAIAGELHIPTKPLSRQSLAILGEARALTGDGTFVFPALGKPNKCMCENTVNGALRRMGFDKSEMTAHGFRAMASTLLNELGKWNPDAIERALAHRDSDQVRGAYHRGAYWNERVEMAQGWSVYLDTLRKGAEVLPFVRAHLTR